MGRGYYIIEISSSHTQIFITAFNVEKPQSLILEIPEKRAKYILQQFNEDFEALASCLTVANHKKLILLNPHYNPRIKSPHSTFFKRDKRFNTINNFSSNEGLISDGTTNVNTIAAEDDSGEPEANSRHVKTSQDVTSYPRNQISGAVSQ